MTTLDEIGRKRQAQKAREARWPWWRKIYYALKKAFVRTEEWPNAHSKKMWLKEAIKEMSDSHEHLKLTSDIRPIQFNAVLTGLAKHRQTYFALYVAYGDEIESLFGGNNG